jgi:hypothetical protein
MIISGGVKATEFAAPRDRLREATWVIAETGK